TDGSALGNPGPGGYGAVLIYGKHRKELSAGFRHTTNNRMEIMAAIAALKALTEPCAPVIHSDSQYVVNAMSKGWVQGWKKRGWKRKDGPLKNADLWEELYGLSSSHEVSWKWVKGHAGNPLNERCDQLAVGAAKSKKLVEDAGFSDSGEA
ncbi:MAG: ribonuclease HI, partial [Verrucomicrobiota bacterium]